MSFAVSFLHEPQSKTEYVMYFSTAIAIILATDCFLADLFTYLGLCRLSVRLLLLPPFPAGTTGLEGWVSVIPAGSAGIQRPRRAVTGPAEV